MAGLSSQLHTERRRRGGNDLAAKQTFESDSRFPFSTLITNGSVVTKSMRLLPNVTKVRAGETGQWLRALAVLREEDPDSVSGTYMAGHSQMELWFQEI